MLVKSPLEVPALGPGAGRDEFQESGEPPLSAWKRFLLVLRVIEVRLRFIVVLAAVGLFLGYWDAIKSRWDQYARPRIAAEKQLALDQQFFCPMDPKVARSSYEPNGNVPACPICGMPLSIRRKEQHQELPPGVTGRVQLSPERVQLAGVRTVAIGYQPLWKEITAVGNVVFDVSRVSRVNSRVGGRVQKLYVDRPDVMVCEGKPLIEIHSPNLAEAAQELLQAMRPDAPQGQADVARQRLKSFGIGDAEIDEIVRSGKADPHLVIRAPRTGFVTDQNIVVGSTVEAGSLLLAVAEASSVWIEADVYEKDIDVLESGLKIEAALEAFPHRTFTGKFRQVYPRFESPARTFRVRFEVDNPQHGLRGGMYAAVRLQVPLDQIEPLRSLMRDKPQVTLASNTDAGRTDQRSGQPGVGRPGVGEPGSGEPRPVLAVPEESVIDTGAKKIVYVRRKPGRAADGDVFEGVQVQLGPRGEARVAGNSAAYYPVLHGLRPGDEIAAAGAFLVDAETRLNPGTASMYFGASGVPLQSGIAKPQAERSTPRVEPPASPEPKSPSRAPEFSKSPEPPKPPEPTAAFSAEELDRLSQLSPEDRTLAERQRLCPITGQPLASMAVPHKIMLRGQPVLLCCKGCIGKAKAEPEETLKKVEKFKTEKGR